jgi:hypothetical protein
METAWFVIVVTLGVALAQPVAQPAAAQVERSGVDNWDNRRVLSQNTDKEKTLASMQRIADIRAQRKAQLWINHDQAQRDGQKMSSDFYA